MSEGGYAVTELENSLQSLTCAHWDGKEPTQIVRKSLNWSFSGKGQSHVVGGVDLQSHPGISIFSLLAVLP